MENKINIAEILRDIPKGTKLYSPLFGKCELVGVNTDEYGDFIRVESFFQDGCVKKESRTFSSDGSYFGWYPNAECLLFPSAKMRDWSKFFMRGDVVLNEHSGLVAIFAGWVDDEFTEFNTTINLCKKNNFWGKEKETCPTECFSKVADEERAEFIAAAEKYYDGQYNPETLHVEPVKVIEPKCSFKPFDKVLVRCNEDSVWRCEFFSHYNTFNKKCPYVCLSSVYKCCIPYEDNQHLLGTTNNPK